MGRTARRTEVTECRQCLTYCDRVIEPATCVRQRCPSLYFYDDPLNGSRYMGCAHKVFATEIDVALFEEAQRTRLGYGGVKMSGSPLPQCRYTVEKAYDGNGSAFECVNPEFFEAPEEDPFSFDLRDAL